MAKTTYKTWADGDMVTAAQLNEQIRDNGNAIWKGRNHGDMDYYTSATTKQRVNAGLEDNRLSTIGGVPKFEDRLSYLIAQYTSATGDWIAVVDTDGYLPAPADEITIPSAGIYSVCMTSSFPTPTSSGGIPWYHDEYNFVSLQFGIILSGDPGTEADKICYGSIEHSCHENIIDNNEISMLGVIYAPGPETAYARVNNVSYGATIRLTITRMI